MPSMNKDIKQTISPEVDKVLMFKMTITSQIFTTKL